MSNIANESVIDAESKLKSWFGEDRFARESSEPHMTAETYRFVMSWSRYPEPATGDRQVKLGLHVRLPFSGSDQNGAMCLLPAHAQKEPSSDMKEVPDELFRRF